MCDTHGFPYTELLQWQPVIEAPPAVALPPTGTAVLYGQMPLPSDGNSRREQVLEVVVTKDLPANVELYGYLEVWASFRNRGYYHQGKEWTASSFPPEINFQANNTRRAMVSLPEILVPRKVLPHLSSHQHDEKDWERDGTQFEPGIV